MSCIVLKLYSLQVMMDEVWLGSQEVRSILVLLNCLASFNAL